MADPVLINIDPADAWQKVATNITNGRFIIKSSGPAAYYYTYVDTGSAAPTTTPIGNSFKTDVLHGSTDAVDYYIYAVGSVGQIEAQL